MKKIIFNQSNKENLTYGEALSPAMKITTKENAQEYLKSYVEFLMKNGVEDATEATKIAKSNLAYYAGYYDNKLRERIEDLFECSHPVFGSIKENGVISPEKAFKLGIELGEKNK